MKHLKNDLKLTQKNGLFSSISFLLLSIALMLNLLSCKDAGEIEQKPLSLNNEGKTVKSVISCFKNPDYTARPMARMWFPDATAGIDENDTIAKQINALAKAGFGGVEIAMLADSSSYTNEQAAYCGWGSESWVKLLKKVYNAANAIDGGFRVDVTITAHWPPSINTIDPNDNSAATEISSSITKITASDLKTGSISLNLPAAKTADDKNVRFIFAETFVAANIAKVAEVKDGRFTLDLQTLAKLNAVPVTLDNVTGIAPDGYRFINGVYYAGSPAGIPDKDYCIKMGWDYNETIAAFGPEQADPNETDKIDASGNRKRLADWQYNYRADLSGLELTGLTGDSTVTAGDWVIVSTFYRGTGQMYSGRSVVPIMHNRPYVMNYFDGSGIKAVTDYWQEKILDDELRAMMKENRGSIFEDSIEASSSSSFWTWDMLDEVKSAYAEYGGYKYIDILAAVVASSSAGGGPAGGMPPLGGMPDGTGGAMPGGEGAPGGGMPGVPMPGEGMQGGGPVDGQAMMGGGDSGGGIGFSSASSSFSFNNADLVASIRQDFNLMLGKLFNRQHCVPANEFAAALGCTYRAQAFGLSGVDIAEAATTVDIPEGDNSNKGDGARLLSSSVNLSGKPFLSMEAVTGAPIYRFNWEDILIEAASNFSYGIDRLILHGSAYSKSVNGKNADWPGWDPFGGSFGEPYTYRQPYWDRMNTVADYISRNQSVLQKGKAKIDLAVLVDIKTVFMFSSGNSFQNLINNGYSYNQLSEALLSGKNAVITNRQLYENGPGYKALIVKGVETISVKAMETLIRYAQADLPIIFYRSNPSRIYGTERKGNDIAAVQSLYNKLLKEYPDNVKTADSENDILTILDSLGVESYAKYNVPRLETTLYQDETDETSYYYLFNNVTTFQGMITSGSYKSYKEKGDINGVKITLKGKGVPYILDAMTGEITQAGEYVDNGDETFTIRLDELKAGASTIIAITKNTKDFPGAAGYVTSVEPASGDYEIKRNVEGNPVFRSNAAGVYTVKLSDGASKSVTIDNSRSYLDLAGADWNLVIESYGPTYKKASAMVGDFGIQKVDPPDTTITKIDFGTQRLVNWAEIKATKEQLGKMGVETMNNVSGRGYYSTTFDWDGIGGAYLSLVYGNDQITGITINGKKITAINNITDTLDVGDYLVAGRNEITVELTTTLSKRAKAESAILAAGGKLSFGGTVVDDYGLKKVILLPYSEIRLD